MGKSFFLGDAGKGINLVIFQAPLNQGTTKDYVTENKDNAEKSFPSGLRAKEELLGKQLEPIARLYRSIKLTAGVCEEL